MCWRGPIIIHGSVFGVKSNPPIIVPSSRCTCALMYYSYNGAVLHTVLDSICSGWFYIVSVTSEPSAVAGVQQLICSEDKGSESVHCTQIYKEAQVTTLDVFYTIRWEVQITLQSLWNCGGQIYTINGLQRIYQIVREGVKKEWVTSDICNVEYGMNYKS